MAGVIQTIAWTDERLGTWTYARAEPLPSLAGVVREFWEVRGELSAFRETLLPNGALDLMFNLGPPHRILSDQAPGTWDHSWLSGLQGRALVIESLEGTHLLAARLDPLGAFALFGDAVPRITDRVVQLADIIGDDADALRRELLAMPDPATRFAALERYLAGRRPAQDPVPSFVHEAIAALGRAHGALAIGTLHESLGVSRKHLSVSISRYLGMSAKAYAQVQRFCWTLDRLKERESVDWTRLAYDAGYSDHSHLTRDFQRIGAATPTTYLRARTPDGTAILHESRDE